MNNFDNIRRYVQSAVSLRLRQDWPGARAALNAALALADGSRAQEAEIYALRGLVGLGEGRPGDACHDYTLALAGYEATGETTGRYVAAALDGLGQAYTRLGDPDRAVAALRRAVAMKQGRDTTTSLAISLGNLALALQAAGDPDGADQAYQEAMRQSDADVDLRGRMHQEYGYHLMSRGRFPEALVVLASRLREIGALERAGRLPSPSLERAICAGNLGTVYSEQQDPENARRYYREALTARRVVTPDSLTLATALSNLATVLDEPVEQEQLLHEAIAIAERRAPNSAMLAVARGLLADLLVERGDPRAAVRLADRAVAEAPGAGRFLASALLAAAAAHRELGDWAAAEDLARRAYDETAAVSDRLSDLRPILTLRGQMAQRRGDLQSAARYYDEAISIAEEFRSGADQEPGRERTFGRAQDTYHGRIDVSYERKQPGDARAAFHAAEAFRARTLADLLSSADPGRSVAADATQYRLAAIDRMLGDEGPDFDRDRIRQLTAEREQLQVRAEQDRLRLLAQQPEEADRRFPTPASVPEIQAVLEPDTTLALYQVTADHAYLFKITRDSFTFRRLRPGAAELAGAVDLVLDACRDNRSDPPSGALAQLAEWLTPSLASATGRLIICADAMLAYLPFEALPGLPTSCVVSYAPSATTLVRFGRRPLPPAVREFAGFAIEAAAGLDALPDVVDEVRDSAARFGGRSVFLSGRKVTKKAVRKYAPGSKYVHFAGHSLISDEHPLHSGIPLPDGFLHAFEMFSLGLSAEVVVLSACRSAVGQARPGEGIVGLSRALFAGGARAVLLTRWDVRSLAAGAVIDRFYRALGQGQTPARALAAAVRAARRDLPGAFEHPREWAAFLLLDTHIGA